MGRHDLTIGRTEWGCEESKQLPQRSRWMAPWLGQKATSRKSDSFAWPWPKGIWPLSGQDQLQKALKLGHYILTISIFGFKFAIFWHSDYTNVKYYSHGFGATVTYLSPFLERIFGHEAQLSGQNRNWSLGSHISPMCIYWLYLYICKYIYIYQFLVCIHVHMHIYAYPQSSLRNAAQLNWDWPWPSPDWRVLTTPPTLAPNMPKATEVSGGKTTAKNRIHLTLAQWKKQIP